MGKRLFVAVDVADLSAEIGAVQDLFGDPGGLDYTDPGQAHVTLRFLGDTPTGRVDPLLAALKAAVDASGVDPFEATLRGLGTFPSPEYINVVWLGVGAGAATLADLHEAVESRTVAMGFDPGEHEFTPHVTLARMRHAGGKDRVQSVVRERDPVAGSLTVDAVELVESVRTDDGHRHETLGTIPL